MRPFAAAQPASLQTSEDLLADFERTGDARAFEEIVRRHAGTVYSACFVVTRNAHDAEDAAQAVFLTLAVHARTANGIVNVGGWVQKVARRTALDLIRSRKRRRAREQAHEDAEASRFQSQHPAHDVGMHELKALLREEIAKLPAKYRLPLILHYFGGMTPDEVSAEVGCRPKTLAVRLFRARKLLADQLRHRGIMVGGSLMTFAVADAILSALANRLGDATGGAAHVTSAGGPLTCGPSPLSTAIAGRVLRIARICLHATARPKYVILFLLMVSAALANPPTGIRDLVHQAPGPQEILNGAMQYLVRSLSGLQRRMSQSEPSVSRNLPAARTLMPVTAPAMEVIGTPVADARMNPRPQWDLALANPLDVPRQHSTLVAAATEFNDVLPPRPSSMASAPVTLTGASSAHADARAVDAGSFVWMPPSHADAARAAVASLASAAPSVSSPTAPLGDTGTLDFSPPRVLTAAPVSDIAPITGIPEPAGALLIAGAATLLLRRRRHRRPPQ